VLHCRDLRAAVNSGIYSPNFPRLFSRNKLPCRIYRRTIPTDLTERWERGIVAVGLIRVSPLHVNWHGYRSSRSVVLRACSRGRRAGALLPTGAMNVLQCDALDFVFCVSLERRMHVWYSELTAMKILALEKEVPGVAEDDFTVEILELEARKAWQLYQLGVLRELYFSVDKDQAVLVLECDNAEEARRQLSELPLVRAGLIDFQIIPLVPFEGFARLFAGKLSKRRGPQIQRSLYS